jgi:hypothetical protein
VAGRNHDDAQSWFGWRCKKHREKIKRLRAAKQEEIKGAMISSRPYLDAYALIRSGSKDSSCRRALALDRAVQCHANRAELDRNMSPKRTAHTAWNRRVPARPILDAWLAEDGPLFDSDRIPAGGAGVLFSAGRSELIASSNRSTRCTNYCC